VLFLPYSTDAPIYHWPIATAVLIATNVLVFFLTTWQVASGNIDIEDAMWLTLQFDVINPIQWITHSFIHINPLGLLKNMLFLWTFGMVIEGKMGALFLFVAYMGTHVVCAALAQTFFFLVGAEGFAIGAANGVFALMALALLWAPENEMSCVLFYPRFGRMAGGLTGELKISTLATGFLFIELIVLWASGFLVWEAASHLFAMALGSALGLIMLRKELVDCEDWDLISRNDWLHDIDWLCSPERKARLSAKESTDYDPVAAALAQSSSQLVSGASNMAARSGTMTKTTAQQKADAEAAKKAAERANSKSNGKKGLFGRGKAKQEEVAEQALPTPQENAQAHPEFNRWSMLLRQAIQANSVVSAQQHFGKLDQLGIAIGLSDKTLFAFVKLLAGNQQWLPAMRPLQLVVSHNGPMAADARLRIAQVQFKVLHQPVEAVKTLRQIQFPAETLTEPQRKILQQRDQLMSQCGVRPGMVAKRPSGE